eukprot:12928707-Prorocentrum_lima.AAC.1
MDHEPVVRRLVKRAKVRRASTVADHEPGADGGPDGGTRGQRTHAEDGKQPTTTLARQVRDRDD